MRKLIDTRVPEMSVIALVLSITTAFALHSVIISVATYQFTPEGAFRLPTTTLYGAATALAISATLLAVAIRYGSNKQ
jgi:hypothetical protein